MIVPLFFLIAQSIAQPVSLYPRVILPGEGVGTEFWLTAPEIDEVAIRSIEPVGDEVQLTPGGLTVRLARISAQVELSLKGDVPRGTVQFYFFLGVPTESTYVSYLPRLEAGKRYVVFLRRDGDFLRTFTDVVCMNVRLRGGANANLVTAVESGAGGVGGMVAELALTPSERYESGFAETLDYALEKAKEFASPGVAFRLTRKLLSHPADSIREHACLTLVTNFGYEDPCLLALSRSKDPAIRAEGSRELREPSNMPRPVVSILARNPSSLSLSGRVEDLSDCLEVFTFDLDAPVRKAACEALGRVFPNRRFENCVR